MSLPSHVAVVGAGVSGLSCARALRDAGVRVTVFDKGRSVGGRLAVRRSGAHAFDLGTQYFTVREPRMEAALAAWIGDGLCAPWPGRIVSLTEPGVAPAPVAPTPRYVGVPDMNALAHRLARGLDVASSHRVERIEITPAGLRLRGSVGEEGVTLAPAGPDAAPTHELGTFDALALCMPPAQAAALLDTPSPALAAEARTVTMAPCFALGFAPGEADAKPLAAIPFDGAFVGRRNDASRSTLSWIARDSSKPGRPAGERWVLHASPAWSRSMFDAPAEEVTLALLAAFARLLSVPPVRPVQSFLRRWAHASPEQRLACGAFHDADRRIAVGGDWTSGGRFEGAFVSGLEVARRLLEA